MEVYNTIDPEWYLHIFSLLTKLYQEEPHEYFTKLK